jgi:hypothetical protein
LGYFKKHWQGALPLAVSFWINLVLLAFLWHVIGALLSGHIVPIRPDKASFFFLAHLAFQSPITIWQTVGVWRSAKTALGSSGKRISVRLAQAIAIFIFVVNHLNYVVVDYEDNMRMAHLFVGFEKDPYGDFNITTLEGNSTIRLSGSLGLGITGKLERRLQKNENISRVVLSSPGGWVYEGKALFRVIRAASLDTVVLDECSSSCTMALVAGNMRSASVDARIGLHGFRAATRSFNTELEQNEAAELFVSQGVDSSLVDRMFETPPDRLWYPPVHRLVEAGLINRVID